ncbi:MAG: hypothetical protein U9O97_00150, partial [Elusimicrobiota bacterium]|nr:hypothetical protein [Elusimicrobiota bacterium]
AKVQTITATNLDSMLIESKAALTIKYGSGQELQVLVPGENYKPGSTQGKDGSPSAQTAGVEFTVTARLCDDYWNVKTDSSVTVNVTGNDPYGIDPTPYMFQGEGSFDVTYKTAWQGTVQATWTVTATAADWTSYTSAKVPVIPASVKHLQVLLPGETAAPGSSSGKTGSVSSATAGVPFVITVKAVDEFWNIQPASNPVVGISADSAYFEKQTDHGLVNGTTVFWLTLKDAERDPWLITASTTDGKAILPDISSDMYIQPASVEKLMILAPGEAWEPGSGTGRTGTPSTRTAGVDFNMTLRTVDAYWNKVDQAANIKLSASDPNKSDVTGINFNGLKVQAYALRTANSPWSVTVSTTDGANFASHTTGNIYVAPAAATQLLVIVPGETFDEGSADGKADAPVNQTAGDPFNITVLACDDYFNKTTAEPTVGITTTDPYDSAIGSQQLVAGVTTFVMDFRKAHSSWTITTSNDGGYTDNTSSQVYVNPGTAVKLQILAPDEIADDGNVSNGGKTGNVVSQQAGISFSITVRGVDQFWNLQEEAVAEVQLTSNYVGDYVVPVSSPLAGDGLAVFEVSLAKANTTSYLTADDIDGIELTQYNHAGIKCVPGLPAYLMVLLPNETQTPAESPGKTGTPTPQTAGSEFTVTVYSVDSNYNTTPTTATVKIGSSDSNALLPQVNTLVAGATNFAVTLKTANGYRTVFADEFDTGFGFSSDPVSTSTVFVNPGEPVKLAAIMQGIAYLPGTENGISGAPAQQTAGVQFTITVRAVDELWNTVASTSPTVSIALGDTNATPPDDRILYSGVSTFTVTFKTADALVGKNWTITASDISSSLVSTTTAPVPVEPNYSNKRLLAVLPNQTRTPGQSPGRSGSVSWHAAGSTFTFTVYDVDNNFNICDSRGSYPEVSLVTTDGYAVDEGDKWLINGQRDFWLSPRIANTTHTVTVTGAAYTQNISSQYEVKADTNDYRLITLLPGMTYDPGSDSGYGDSPSSHFAGSTFTVNVKAVDRHWNLINTRTDKVTLSVADHNADILVNPQFLASGEKDFEIVPKTVGSTWTVDSAAGGYITYRTPQFEIVPSPAVKLQVLLPGETAAPGTETGKTGTPDNRTAGAVFTITVNCVDSDWNVNTLDNPLVRTTTTDPDSIPPGDHYLDGGTTTFVLMFKTANSSWTITAADQGGGRSSYESGVAADVYVNPDSPVKLLVLLPGETDDPGSDPGISPFGGSDGKSDWTAENQTAGAAFTVTVMAVDSWWNINTGTSPIVQITSTDGNADVSDNNKALTDGATAFSVIMKTANSSWTITAVNTDGTLSDYQSSAFYVNPNTPARLRVLLPGQTRQPGTADGKSGAPSDRTAGAQFTITVDACDNWWNTNASTSPVVTITSEDTNAVLPGAAALSSGSGSFSFTFKTANASWTVTTTNTDGALISSETAKIQVSPASAVKLLCLASGETYVPGSDTGKSGTPVPWVAGEPSTVTVYGVDGNWNINTSAGDIVSIDTEDPYDVEPADQPLVNGATTFVVILARAAPSWVKADAATLDFYQTSSVSVATNTATKLLVLVPGVDHEPGEWSGASASVAPYGRTGAPSNQTAGEGFSVTVMAVDNWWNRRYDAGNIVKIVTEDPNDDLYHGFDPAAKALTDGMAVFISTMVTNDPSGIGNQWQITVSTNDGSALASDVSEAVTMISGDIARLQILLPDEISSPGTDTGLSGTVSTQTAGVEFTVTVNAADQYWNFVNNPSPVNPLVNIETDDPYDQDWGFDPVSQQLSAGTKNFAITMVTEGDWQIYGYSTNYGYIPATSSLLHVKYGAAARYQVLLPTQTAVAGSPAGKTSEPVNQTAGIVFTATVNITDAYWNIVPTESPSANITTHDSFDTDPGNVQLTNGSTTFPVIIKTASHGIGSFSSTQTITADTGYQSDKSSVFGVNSYAPQKLLLLAPGETYVPGDTANLGRGGSPDSQPAGVVFTVTVISCDQYYNQTSTNTDITIDTTDP